MGTARAIGLRLFYGLLSLIFISFIVFLADELRPGDAATIRGGDKASAEVVEKIRKQMGLDQPAPVRFVSFIGKAARGDFGESYSGVREPVSKIIARNLPMTLTIASCAIILAALIGISLGTLAAVRENRLADRAILVFSTLGVTVPNFVLAPLLVWLFALQLDYLPQTWEDPLRGPVAFYLILPVIVLSLRPMTLLTRLTRASMVETLKQEFIRLATAKGVPSGRLIFVHGLRNALSPILTALGSSFGYLLTGSFVVERFFTLPGLGREGIEAIQREDMPVIQAVILITGALFITINLVIDILLPFVDPRIRESRI